GRVPGNLHRPDDRLVPGRSRRRHRRRDGRRDHRAVHLEQARRPPRDFGSQQRRRSAAPALIRPTSLDRHQAIMGLLDTLNGMQNGSRGASSGSAPSRGGMSPMMMALLGLLAYKAVKGGGLERMLHGSSASGQGAGQGAGQGSSQGSEPTSPGGSGGK